MFVDTDHKWIRPDKLVNDTGKLGVKGKTPCKDCICMKPDEVCRLAT